MARRPKVDDTAYSRLLAALTDGLSWKAAYAYAGVAQSTYNAWAAKPENCRLVDDLQDAANSLNISRGRALNIDLTSEDANIRQAAIDKYDKRINQQEINKQRDPLIRAETKEKLAKAKLYEAQAEAIRTGKVPAEAITTDVPADVP